MLSPLALLWFLPIGGAITLLYILKQKRQDTRVASLLLWEQVLGESPAATTPFQRLRVDPLLILQLLLALLLAAALARPFAWRSALGGNTVILVLDASASMNATDVPGGRFAAAVAEARRLIESKTPAESIALIRAGTNPETLAPLTTDKAKLLAALSRAQPSDAIAGPRDALLLAASLARGRGGANITLLTDGAFARQDDIALGGASFTPIVVGKRGENVGITAFDVRGGEDDTAPLEAFVSVANAGTVPRTVPLELRAGDALLDAREIALEPGETKSVAVPLAATDIPPAADLLSARIESRDDLAADNEAYAAPPPRGAVKITLVSNGDDPFLERALLLTPRADLSRVTPATFGASDAAGAAVTVWDAAAAPPADLPPGSYLFFGAAPTGALSPVAADTGAVDAPVVLDWDHASPLLRFCDLSGVRVRTARSIKPAPWASTLIETKTAPLALYGEHNGARVVYVAFRPTQSDFPLRVAFPVFVANAVSALTTPSDAGAARVIRPGTGGADTDHVGILRASTGNAGRTAVSLLSPTETATTPQSPLPLAFTDTPTDAAAPSGRRAPHEWWQYLAAPLLVFLLLEGWLFKRSRR